MSPIFVCLALTTLMPLLNEATMRYRWYGQKVNHLMNIDDLEHFAKSNMENRNLMKIVHNFSSERRINKELEKRVRVSLTGRKRISFENNTLNIIT